jgi:GAF domain-containing protein
MTQVEAMTRLRKIGGIRPAGARMLRAALDDTGSTCGFTGIMVDHALRILDHDGITWQNASRRRRHDAHRRSLEARQLEFTDFDNLIGQVLLTGVPVVVNDPQDPRLGRLPLVAYPPLHSFLGVPVFDGDQVIGIIGVANGIRGYSTKDRERLELVARKPRTRRTASV